MVNWESEQVILLHSYTMMSAIIFLFEWNGQRCWDIDSFFPEKSSSQERAKKLEAKIEAQTIIEEKSIFV